ncbi:MAG: tail fiber domain-containing protein, partial [Cyanobacteriota bacterium]|nr:tail fiber domain-containing protein [Cyanobacteriota bacterium]
MVIAPGGNVGIGVTNPGYKLDVGGDINFTGDLYKNGVLFSSGGGTTSQWTTTGTDIYYNLGNVGIGVTNPGNKLEVAGNIMAKRDNFVRINVHDTTQGGLGWGIDHGGFGGPVDSFGIVQNGVAPRMVFLPNGNVGIGVTNPTVPLDVRTSMPGIYAFNYVWDNGNNFFSGPYEGLGLISSIYGSGHIVSGTGFAFSSDERIKRDIVSLNDSEALTSLRQIEPVKYKYKDVIQRGEVQVLGFIAQQVQTVLPSAVETDFEYIPDFYQFVDIVQPTTLRFPKHYVLATEGRLRVIDEQGRTIDVLITTVEDETTEDCLVGIDVSVQSSTGKIFCFGRLVPDFLRLKKDHLFAVNFAATQELDRQVVQLKSENQGLRSELQALSTEKESLKTRLTVSES